MDARSEKSLKGVHPDLVAVMRRAADLSPVKFKVIEGVRSAKRQAALKKAGKSQVKVSRHQSGHAVDIAATVNGKISWNFPLYTEINDAVQRAARDMGIPIIWGGVWKSLKDGGHFELPKAQYPSDAPHVATKIVPKPMPKPEPVSWFDSLDEKEREKVVKAVQKDLLGHGYTHVGGIDGLIGDRTRSAIRDFRSKNELPIGDHIDDALIEALQRPDAVRPVIAPERQNATLTDLQEKGSVIADSSKKTSKGAIATVVAGVGTVASQVVESAGGLMNLGPALDPLRWLFDEYGVYIFGTVLVGMGGFFWWYAKRSGEARLRDHREGNTAIVNLPAHEE